MSTLALNAFNALARTAGLAFVVLFASVAAAQASDSGQPKSPPRVQSAEIDGAIVSSYANAGRLADHVEFWFVGQEQGVRPGQRLSGTPWLLTTLAWTGAERGYLVQLVNSETGTFRSHYFRVGAARSD